MKNRILSCILIIIFMIMSFSSLASAGEEKVTSAENLEYFVDKYSSLSHEDRANLEVILVPLLITDTGLDTLKKTISDYTPESESIFHVMLRKVLRKVDKEDLIKYLSHLYMIDEKLREDYIGGFYRRQELTLSATSEAMIVNLLEKSFKKYPALQKIFEEDGINEKVIARGLKLFVAANNGIALFAESEDGKLEINQISSSLSERINLVIQRENLEYENADKLILSVCEKLNGFLGSSYMDSFAVLGRELGLVKTSSAEGNGNSTGSPSVQPGKNDKKAINATLFSENEESGILVQITENGKTISEGNIEKEKITFTLNRNVYIIAPDGSKVKNFIQNGTEYTLCVTQLGKYIFVDSSESYFSDVDGWGKPFIDDLYERGIISGKGDKIFCPDDNITREEFVKLIVEMFSLKGDFGTAFSDNTKEKWYYEYLSAAKFYKIADGFSDGSFGIGMNITRQDMCKILYSAAKQLGINFGEELVSTQFNDYQSISDYAQVPANELKKYGIISGDENGNFNPKNFATRQEASKMIYNILKCYVEN